MGYDTLVIIALSIAVILGAVGVVRSRLQSETAWGVVIGFGILLVGRL